ncbi:uncharacterized protein LOC116256681 [Nymphaea colorata]|nr:uncharacterized protein LOC116256681 [Nymphaea colorata]
MIFMMAIETSAWMWKKRNFSASNKQSASEGDPWQEQSFAEDSFELLCECIWPPRYYSCSFCRKEFKSAQALGGHMNVHRRDRARLRQSPDSQSEINQHSGGFPDAHQHPPGVSPMVILNPDSRPDHSSPETDPTRHIRGAPTSAVSSSTTFCCNGASKQALNCRHCSYREPPLCDPHLKIAGEFNLSSAGDLKSINDLNCDVPWQELAIGSPESLLEQKISDETMKPLQRRKNPENAALAHWPCAQGRLPHPFYFTLTCLVEPNPLLRI